MKPPFAMLAMLFPTAVGAWILIGSSLGVRRGFFVDWLPYISVLTTSLWAGSGDLAAIRFSPSGTENWPKTWRSYAVAMLFFSVAGFATLCALQRVVLVQPVPDQHDRALISAY